MVALSLVIGVLAIMWAPISAGAKLYKYTNKEGITVLDSQIPPRYAKYGYTILDSDGRVLKVVPGALTPAQEKAREEKLARQKRREEAKKKQEIADQNLLMLYSTPQDVIRARDSKLASIKGFIDTSKGNIERLEEEKRNIESSLANVERAGGKVEKDQVDRIHNINNSVRQIQQEIQDKQNEMVQLRASFAADLKRIRQLYRKNAKNQDSDLDPSG